MPLIAQIGLIELQFIIQNTNKIKVKKIEYAN